MSHSVVFVSHNDNATFENDDRGLHLIILKKRDIALYVKPKLRKNKNKTSRTVFSLCYEK